MINLVNNRTFERNTLGTDYVVGDIHGQYEKLMTQLSQMSFDFRRDRLFSTGDLIDRGPHSERCIQLLEEPWFFSVIGNHEYHLLEGGSNLLITEGMGNHWQFKYSDNYPFLKEIRDLIISHQSLYITLNIGKCVVGIVHACPPRFWPKSDESVLNENGLIEAIWSRPLSNRHLLRDTKGADFVICGHSNVGSIKVLGKTIFIDTAEVTGEFTLVNCSHFEQIEGQYK